VAAIEPHVRAYLTAAIHDPDERREAIADALADAFGPVGPESTIESTRAAAIRRARERSKEWQARQRHMIARLYDREWRADASPVDSGRLQKALSLAAHKALLSDEMRAFRLELATYEDDLVRRLPEDWRAALELHLEGWTDREIAARQDRSLGSVPHLRRKAIRRCRQFVEDGVVSPPPNGLRDET